MDVALLGTLLPFHLRFDGALELSGFGPSATKLGDVRIGAVASDLLAVVRPRALVLDALNLPRHEGKLCICELHGRQRLRGGWHRITSGWLFACSPWLATFDDAKALGITVNEFPAHEPSFDYLLAMQQLRGSLEQSQRMAAKLKVRYAELELAKEAADEASRSKSTFLSTMSHEIRTPMNGIVGMLDVLRDTGLTRDQHDHVDIIDRSADNLLRIINDVLDLARVESGKAGLVVDVVSPAALLSDVRAMFASKAREQSLALEIDVAPDVPAWIALDGARLSQVLYNLVGNALKFTESGSVSVSMSTARAGTKLLVSVRDTGSGMDAKTLERVFEAFERADGARVHAIEGAGLGLAIVRSLVEAMDGSVEATSEVGAGSEFQVRLDLVEAVAEPAVTDLQPAATLAGSVLVVDDNVVNRTVALAHLSALGLSGTAVSNGEEALAAAEADRFDLVLMDCEMPVLDGFDATRALRQRRGWTESVPILALTAAVMGDTRARCLGSGMNDVLAKPLRRTELSQRLGRYLSSPEPPSTP